MITLTRRNFLKSSAAMTAAKAIPAQLAAAHGRKNVLFIGVDDLNHSLGCYGQPVHTPNLDALAARGVRFDAAYCQYPLCGPSRTSLLTGLAPDTTKIQDNNDLNFRKHLKDPVTLPELFRKNGYYVARVGKIYHANVPPDEGSAGADDPQSWDYTFNNAGLDRTDPAQAKSVTTFSAPEKIGLGTGLCAYESPTPDRQITDGVGADEVISLLKANKDKPFFIAYGLYRPHLPWIVPQAYFEKYPLESIHAEPFDPAELTQAPPYAYMLKKPNFGMSEENARRSKRGYYAATSYIDAQVGRVLAALKEYGLEENTIVVFWADHGWHLGQHGQWEKLTLFEWCARIPFLMAGPGVKKGGVVDRTTEHLDIYPTLVELCGLENAPKLLHGTSLSGLLQNPDGARWDKPAMTQAHRPAREIDGYSIRTERYRYTLWMGKSEAEELYDYQTDPREVKNRASDPELKTVKKALKDRLLTIRKSRIT
ncbi:MAG: sulfatase-like hydrolase/transferase [Acidobacteriaceae bacterium]|nr:sulfatase-like hydrolase/transferase [Acidobacteriaceae bacterium]